MTVEQTFDDCVKVRGGRLPRETANEHVRTVLDSFEEQAQDLIDAARRELPALPDVHVDFVANSRVNAVAFRADGCYFIGIYAGTLILLQQILHRLLADARLFPAIGNPAVERQDLPPLAHLASDALAMLEQEQLLQPVDPIRQQYASFLQHQAMMFLVGHELAHITCGHVAYLEAKRQQRLTVEVGGFTRQSENERLERQALEHHADTRSVYSRIDSLRFTFTNPNRDVALWRPDAAHPLDLLSDWALSVHLMFHLFGDVRFNGEQLDRNPYPPLAARRLACDYLAISAASQMFGAGTQPAAITAIRRARRDINVAFATMFGRAVEPEGTQQDEELLHTHARRLTDHFFKELAPALRGFAHEPL